MTIAPAGPFPRLIPGSAVGASQGMAWRVKLRSPRCSGETAGLRMNGSGLNPRGRRRPSAGSPRGLMLVNSAWRSCHDSSESPAKRAGSGRFSPGYDATGLMPATLRSMPQYNGRVKRQNLPASQGRWRAFRQGHRVRQAGRPSRSSKPVVQADRSKAATALFGRPDGTCAAPDAPALRGLGGRPYSAGTGVVVRVDINVASFKDTRPKAAATRIESVMQNRGLVTLAPSSTVLVSKVLGSPSR